VVGNDATESKTGWHLESHVPVYGYRAGFWVLSWGYLWEHTHTHTYRDQPRTPPKTSIESSACIEVCCPAGDLSWPCVCYLHLASIACWSCVRPFGLLGDRVLANISTTGRHSDLETGIHSSLIFMSCTVYLSSPSLSLGMFAMTSCIYSTCCFCRMQYINRVCTDIIDSIEYADYQMKIVQYT